MKWNKLGIIFCPKGEFAWAKSHALVPTPIFINSETLRIYINCLDAKGISRPGYLDYSVHDLSKPLFFSPEPILDLGLPGTFDDNGVMVCSVVKVSDNLWHMYYVGFELGEKIRYRLFTGLAISKDGGASFLKYSDTPILERSSSEKYFRTAPFCLCINNKFKLWYAAGSSWKNINGKDLPIYDLRYLESDDGINWGKKGKIVMPLDRNDEHGFGRPYIFIENGIYKMFYSIRKVSCSAYRIGYAESLDGTVWNRMDNQLNFDVTEKSFDSEAIMFAAPIKINNKLYLFYNGNNFGKDGFALAILENN